MKHLTFILSLLLPAAALAQKTQLDFVKTVTEACIAKDEKKLGKMMGDYELYIEFFDSQRGEYDIPEGLFKEEGDAEQIESIRQKSLNRLTKPGFSYGQGEYLFLEIEFNHVDFGLYNTEIEFELDGEVYEIDIDGCFKYKGKWYLGPDVKVEKESEGDGKEEVPAPVD